MFVVQGSKVQKLEIWLIGNPFDWSRVQVERVFPQQIVHNAPQRRMLEWWTQIKTSRCANAQFIQVFQNTPISRMLQCINVQNQKHKFQHNIKCQANLVFAFFTLLNIPVMTMAMIIVIIVLMTMTMMLTMTMMIMGCWVCWHWGNDSLTLSTVLAITPHCSACYHSSL